MKKTLDKNLAENLSPITKKLDEVNETTKKLGDIIKETISDNETPLLAVEITQNETSQPSIQNYQMILIQV